MGNKKHPQNPMSSPKSNNKQGILNDLLENKRLAIFVAIITATGTIIVAFISQGIFNPAINNFLYPKHAVVETSFILPYNNAYPYCVVFESNQEYRIKVSTDGTPVNLHVIPEANYIAPLSNGTITTSETEQRIINGTYPYSPTKPGQYRVLVVNNVGNQLPEYANKTVFVNLIIEANRICAT